MPQEDKSELSPADHIELKIHDLLEEVIEIRKLLKIIIILLIIPLAISFLVWFFTSLFG